ncbi:alanine--tRNA ligase [Candidatus Fukatsuia endosymbiont of Tuberolachnus salignus]|uniref:alanine--tRNA ligase n=1 Tax=Candidatus Fukatsuia endosymbiont of Tuberolachnus salignus TaxID=3077957 RepID=UPI00313BAB8D
MSKSTAEIRQAFLDFFRNKGHRIVSSSFLIPDNDPTLLFTNAGMNQFKDVFLGLDKRDYSRAATSQRCIRAGGKHNDLKNVGHTARHHTFFEMLGNFSFGDYFKHEAIHFAWELLTSKQWFNLPQNKLWITVYHTDDEAYNIWSNEIGVPHERIIRIGDNKGSAFASDNFWQMGDTGPCGPCSEIFYDHGDHIFGGPPGSPEEDGDRYIEIWNIVFMQFDRQCDGTMLPLFQPSVDTGMGLERLAAVLQHVNSNYEIDLFRDLIAAVASIIGITDLSSQSLRVIADHIRSCAFLISDGVIPSNENRGYVLRRIIRRAIRHGNMLGTKDIFFYKLVAPLIAVMGSAADELKRRQSMIEQLLRTEEEQFARTLERGLALLDEELSKLIGDTLDGTTAFRLYDTYGFPIDLTADVCRERAVKVDEAGFEQAMQAQRRRARESGGFAVDYSHVIRVENVSQFSGYEHMQQPATITALFHNGKTVNEIHPTEEAVVVLDKTPFYAESGGQVGDTGELKNTTDAHFVVANTQKYGQAIAHLGRLTQGCLRVQDKIDATVDAARRNRIRLNHSATHLLHAALRKTLGEHVSQKGSLVNDKYLRFDFSHTQAMGKKQIHEVEALVNAQIRCNQPIQTEIMALEVAKKRGALALFGEKYDDQVRVLVMGDFSTELCGGTHASRTGDIGLFRITAESATAAGIRRIEAVTGEKAIALLHQESDLLQKISHQVKGDSHNVLDKIRLIQDRGKTLERELHQLKGKQTAQESASLLADVKQIKGVKLLVKKLDNVAPEMLRTVVDSLKNQLGSAIIVLATATDNKVNLIVGITKNLINKVKAGDLIADIAGQVGGKGGGRSDMAEAGGTNVEALPSALISVEAWVNARL